MQRNYDYIFKVCFLGQAGVGKTALMRRYADDTFQDSMLSTIGVDFRFKSMNMEGNFVKLQLWDTAGQERFRSVVESYYRDADAVILVYDVQNPGSLEMLDDYWLEMVRRNSKKDCGIYVFANKSDVGSGAEGGGEAEGRGRGKERGKKQESEDEARQEMLQREGVRSFRVSAKTGQGVVESVNQIVSILMSSRPKIEGEKMVMTLNEYNPPKKKGCCR